MGFHLSETVLALIPKARIVSFAQWQLPSEAIARFQAADDERRYLTDEDLAAIAQFAPATTVAMPVVQLLRDRVSEIVTESRAGVLQQFPGITDAGGNLYPPERAEACWRDFWQFLRCITYGIAGQHQVYTSSEGLHYMQLLYRELKVPLDAMVMGLENIKTASLQRIDPIQRNRLSPYFDHLIDQMKAFTE